MVFQPGHPKLGGAKKGSIQKVSKGVRDLIEVKLGKSLPETILDITSEIYDPVAKAGILLQLMKYAYPQLKQIAHNTSESINGMTDLQKLEHLQNAVSVLQARLTEETKDNGDGPGLPRPDDGSSPTDQSSGDNGPVVS